MLHDLDTGFLAQTLKPAFQALGHNCTVLQTMNTYLEPNPTHIDHLLSTVDDTKPLIEIFKETDLFIIRTITDTTLRLSGVIPFISPHNTIWRVHGSELRERNIPYTLRTWRINLHNKEPLLVGHSDPSLFPLYRQNTITCIERPCAFDTFPRKRTNKQQPFALTTPTNFARKGTQPLIDNWKSHIPLQVLHGASRKEVLQTKARASYLIDNTDPPPNAGFYGMNSVEAWFYKIPVFSKYYPMDEVTVPNISKLIINSDNSNVQHNIEQYSPDNKQLNYARNFALSTHDPLTIAKQYTLLLSYIQ